MRGQLDNDGEDSALPEPSAVIKASSTPATSTVLPTTSLAQSPVTGGSCASPTEASLSLVSSPPLSVSNPSPLSWGSAVAGSSTRRQAHPEDSPLELASPFELQTPAARRSAQPWKTPQRRPDGGEVRSRSPPRTASGHNVELAAARATLVELERDLGSSPLGNSSRGHQEDAGNDCIRAVAGGCGDGASVRASLEAEAVSNREQHYREQCAELRLSELRLRDEVRQRDSEVEALRRALSKATGDETGREI